MPEIIIREIEEDDLEKWIPGNFRFFKKCE